MRFNNFHARRSVGIDPKTDALVGAAEEFAACDLEAARVAGVAITFGLVKVAIHSGHWFADFFRKAFKLLSDGGEALACPAAERCS
jgi:hypothetical protein